LKYNSNIQLCTWTYIHRLSMDRSCWDPSMESRW